MMDRNNLSTPEKFKYIAILAGSWGSIVLPHLWVAKSPKPMTHTLQFWGMAMMFWTVMAAVYSIVFLLKILLVGRYDASWKIILLPAIASWLGFALFAHA